MEIIFCIFQDECLATVAIQNPTEGSKAPSLCKSVSLDICKVPEVVEIVAPIVVVCLGLLIVAK